MYKSDAPYAARHPAFSHEPHMTGVMYSDVFTRPNGLRMAESALMRPRQACFHMSQIFALSPLPPPTVAVAGTTARFPVHRIYCVGRNYAEHAREMGAPVDRGSPVFFMKPADAVVADGAELPFPQATSDLHHEVELVVAIGLGGVDIAEGDALDHVFGYAVGVDLTRRDLQAIAKEQRLPWDTAKGFDRSAPLSAVHRFEEVGHPDSGQMTLMVNGEQRQQGELGDMIFKVPFIVHALSRLFELEPGDLIFTGTPAGVGPLLPGDAVVATCCDFARLEFRIAAGTPA